jgi:transposase
MEVMTQLPPCLIGMEACGGSHCWARKFSGMGHTVKSHESLICKALCEIQ